MCSMYQFSFEHFQSSCKVLNVRIFVKEKEMFSYVVILLLVLWYKRQQYEMQNYMLFDRCVLKIIAGMCCNTQVGNTVI